MKTLYPAAAAFGLTLMAQGAFAGSLDPVAPEPVLAAPPAAVVVAPVSDWSGAYVGGTLGYGTAATDGGLVEDADGLTYGAHAGYLADLGQFVVGAEVEALAGDISDANTGASVDSVLMGKLRAGYDAGAFMPYVTVGASQLDAAGTKDNGYVAGVGLDYQMTDSFRIGAEVLGHKYEDFGGSGVDQDLTTVGVRASFTF